MAYMTKDGRGPYPNKAGEYCGNHLVNSKPYGPHRPFLRDSKTQITMEAAYLSTMIFGIPHSCEAGTSEEMIKRGYVGLYLKKNCPLRNSTVPGCIEVPTPLELMEPFVLTMT